MATIATIWAELGLNTDKYDRGLDKALSDTQSKLKNIGGTLTKVGGVMTAAITLPILAAAKSSVDAASDLAESQNAVNVVFQDSAKILENYSKTSAETVGLAKSDFNQLSAVTGAFLKNLGYDTNQAANETIKLTERAADMASIFNTDVSQALGAIQSGLKGEFNPLEQFGVKLNAATIEAYALSHGLASTKAELTDNIKAQAALALIYEQTDQFAGDFKNTSDGLANSSRILKAQIKDMSAEMGQNLLPVATELVKTASKLVEGFTNLPAPVQKGIVYFGLFVAAIGPLLIGIGSVVSAVGTIGGALGGLGITFGGVTAAATGTATALWAALIPAIAAIGPVILAILPAAALLYFAFKYNFGGIRTTAEQLWFILKVGFKNTFHEIGITLAQLSVIMEHEAKTGWGSFVDFMKTKIETLAVLFKGVLVPAVNSAIQWIVNGFGAGLQWVAGAINYVVASIKRLSDSLKNLRLPSWLTPGSPTPFEIGLRGIGAAVTDLSNVRLPQLQASVSVPEGTGGGSPVTSIGSIVINANVNGEQDWDFVAQKIKEKITGR